MMMNLLKMNYWMIKLMMNKRKKNAQLGTDEKYGKLIDNLVKKKTDRHISST